MLRKSKSAVLFCTAGLVVEPSHALYALSFLSLSLTFRRKVRFYSQNHLKSNLSKHSIPVIKTTSSRLTPPPCLSSIGFHSSSKSTTYLLFACFVLATTQLPSPPNLADLSSHAHISVGSGLALLGLHSAISLFELTLLTATL